MEAKLTEAVHYSLDNYLYHNATFLAEVRTPSSTRMTSRLILTLPQRLHAQSPSDDSLHLLATCYMQQGKPNKAVAVLKVRGILSLQHLR